MFDVISVSKETMYRAAGKQNSGTTRLFADKLLPIAENARQFRVHSRAAYSPTRRVGHLKDQRDAN